MGRKSSIKPSFLHNILRQLPQIARLSAGSASENIFTAVSAIVMNKYVLLYQGTMGIAVFGLALSFKNLISAVWMGFNNALSPLLSVFKGENNCKGTNMTLRIGTRYALVLSLILMGIIAAYPQAISRIFRFQDTSLISRCNVAIRIIVLMIPFAAVNSIMSHYYQIYRHTFLANALMLCRGFVILLAIGLFLLKFASPYAFYFTYPITEIVTMSIWLGYTSLYMKQRKGIDCFLLPPQDPGEKCYSFLMKGNAADISDYRVMLQLFLEKNQQEKATIAESLLVFDMIMDVLSGQHFLKNDFVDFRTLLSQKGIQISVKFNFRITKRTCIDELGERLLALNDCFCTNSVLGFHIIDGIITQQANSAAEISTPSRFLK